MCYFATAAHARRLLCLCFAVQQKQSLEKETGLKIVEAGVSDVSGETAAHLRLWPRGYTPRF